MLKGVASVGTPAADPCLPGSSVRRSLGARHIGSDGAAARVPTSGVDPASPTARERLQELRVGHKHKPLGATACEAKVLRQVLNGVSVLRYDPSVRRGGDLLVELVAESVLGDFEVVVGLEVEPAVGVPDALDHVVS